MHRPPPTRPRQSLHPRPLTINEQALQSRGLNTTNRHFFVRAQKQHRALRFRLLQHVFKRGPQTPKV